MERLNELGDLALRCRQWQSFQFRIIWMLKPLEMGGRPKILECDQELAARSFSS